MPRRLEITLSFEIPDRPAAPRAEFVYGKLQAAAHILGNHLLAGNYPAGEGRCSLGLSGITACWVVVEPAPDSG